MATLDMLKRMLRQKAIDAAPSLASSTQKLSDSQYASGFGILKQNQEWTTYQDFVIPQLSLILAPLFDSHPGTSILEVGPGPKSVLGYLPRYLRQKVKRYAAYEPNDLFASELEEWLCSTSEIESPLPCLERSSDIKRTPFAPNSKTKTGGSVGAEDPAEGFDVVLFCHSLYGMRPKHEFIECALNMLTESPRRWAGATCPTGVVRVTDNDDVLDRFSRFVAGFVMQDLDSDKAVRFEWRKACRSLVVVKKPTQATSLPELISKVPLVLEDKNVKSWQARSHRPTSIITSSAGPFLEEVIAAIVCGRMSYRSTWVLLIKCTSFQPQAAEKHICQTLWSLLGPVFTPGSTPEWKRRTMATGGYWALGSATRARRAILSWVLCW
ncbi:hypothetical protein Q7P37_009786 [Cladosporium fusiforme]